MWRVRTNFESGFSMIDSEFCLLSSGEVWDGLSLCRVSKFEEIDSTISMSKFNTWKFAIHSEIDFLTYTQKYFTKKMLRKNVFDRNFIRNHKKITKIAYQRFSKYHWYLDHQNFDFWLNSMKLNNWAQKFTQKK